MSQIKYLDKYDKEFVNLMLEINSRLENFSKLDKIKINSWIKSLCLPTNNLPWKKNRNLYALKLLDNILNFKLEKPFTKFAELSENLPMLDSILVKSQLSNKIKIIMNNIHPDIQIKNFIEANMGNNLNYEQNQNLDLDILNKNRPIYRMKTPTANEIKKRYNFNGVNNNNKDNRIKKGNIRYNNMGINNINNYNTNSFYKGDQLLNKNYFDFDKKLNNEPGYFKKTKPNFESQKSQLKSTIEELENEISIKNELINQQDLDIQQLKNKVMQLEKRVKIAFKDNI